MFIAGLTGNYGMGKSSVLLAFRDLGAVTVESDRIVDELLEEKGVIADMKGLLGPGVTDREGKLDKKAIAEKIFSNPESRKSVESLIHPLVFERIERLTDSVGDGDRVVIIEVPLLFEGNYRERFRRVITVYTTEETALGRLEASGIPRREALLRLNSQMPIGRKMELADYTINNNGSREETREQVLKVYLSLLEDKGKHD